MINGCGPSCRPLQEVVEFGLQLPVLDVSPVGPVVDGLAQETHPGSMETARPIAGGTRVFVVQLKAGK